MPTLLAPDNVVVLEGVSWATYERLLAEHENKPGTRLTYDRGRLEITVASAGHEYWNRAIGVLVEAVAVATGRDVCQAGSTTFRREDLDRGFEPDSCFYFARAAEIREKDELDLTIDPPPELAIEVDISRSWLKKLPVFAAVGVPEVWRFDGHRLTMHVLDRGEYRSAENSSALPPLSAARATEFVLASRKLARGAWLRSIHAWLTSSGYSDGSAKAT